MSSVMSPTREIENFSEIAKFFKSKLKNNNTEKLQKILTLIEEIASLDKDINITVEGNIGTGKSFFLLMCEIPFLSEIFNEPVKSWEKFGILKKFYEDPQKYALLFQSLTFATRMALCGQKKGAKITVNERSVWADRYCFAENLAESGIMSEIELRTYQIWHRILINGLIKQTVPDVTCYLMADPETSKRRQEKRARKSEGPGIPLEYFQQLHDKHNKWLIENDEWNVASIGVPPGNKYMKNSPVYVIDLNTDFEDEDDYRIFVLSHVLEMLKKYGKSPAEREEFNARLEEISKFPDETEVLEFIDQLNDAIKK